MSIYMLKIEYKNIPLYGSRDKVRQRFFSRVKNVKIYPLIYKLSNIVYISRGILYLPGIVP